MLCTIAEIARFKHNKKRLLGVDIGERAVGLSLCDTTWTIASPLKVISNEHLISQILKIAQEYQVVGLVIGYPLNMNGTEGPQAQKAKRLAEKILNQQDLPILLWDERLSTVAVTRTMVEADLSRKRQKEVVDKMAASFILQGALEAIKNKALL